MNTVLEKSKEQAQKMTSHADADSKYEAFKKRWTVIGNKIYFLKRNFNFTKIIFRQIVIKLIALGNKIRFFKTVLFLISF